MSLKSTVWAACASLMIVSLGAGAVALVAATANYTIATLASGKHKITAHFDGSVDELESTSPAVVVTIT